MSSYKPPFARMRQIVADKPPRPDAELLPVEELPANVEEALAQMPEPELEPEPEAIVEPEPEVVEYSVKNRKAELLSIADQLGVEADESMTKAEIIELLDDATED